MREEKEVSSTIMESFLTWGVTQIFGVLLPSVMFHFSMVVYISLPGTTSMTLGSEILGKVPTKTKQKVMLTKSYPISAYLRVVPL